VPMVATLAEFTGGVQLL